MATLPDLAQECQCPARPWKTSQPVWETPAQRTPNCEDRDAHVFAQIQEMMVAGYNVESISNDRTPQKDIIVLVGSHHRRSFRHFKYGNQAQDIGYQF